MGRRIRAWLFRPSASQEVEDEVTFHLEMRIREYVASGVDPEAARRLAEARMGDRDRLSEELEEIAKRRNRRRDMRSFWDELKWDFRYSLRQLRRAPGFAALAVLTLAVGIGANSAVFSVVSGVLLEPLPYEEPDELVNISSAFPTLDYDRFWLSPPEYYELREWNESFEELGAYRVGAQSIETVDRPDRVVSAIATWSVFPTLGVSAELGRTFTADEDRMGANPTVLLSHGLWERGFGSDPAVVGRTVRVDGRPATVIGVMPEGFDIDDAGVDVWLPLNLVQEVDPNDHVERRGNHFMNVIARLADGVSLERARTDLDRVESRSLEQYGDQHPLDPELHPLNLSGMQADLVGDVRPALLLLVGAVGFLLLIACANVASLLLARSETRSGEVAVRVAMGAGRGRLTRQLLTEGVTLALLGGAVGLVLGQIGVDVLLGVNPEGVPRTAEIGLDGRVVAFTGGVALMTGIVFGLAPLLAARVGRVASTLREAGTRTTRGTVGARSRKGLVVAEVAMAVVLLVGSGLMIQSVWALQSVDLGFESEGLLTLRLSLPEADYPETTDVSAFYAELLERVRALPGVSSASATSGLPPVRAVMANDTEFEGVAQTSDGPPHNVDYWTGIEEGYLSTLGIDLTEGRDFQPADARAETPVLLVNERLAGTFYPGSSPVGRRIRPCCGEDTPWFTVVGVVEDVKQAGVEAEAGTELYFYHPQITQSGLTSYRSMSVAVRTDGRPLDLAPSVERVVREMDASLPVAEVRTMQEHVDGAVAQPRFVALLLGVFGAIALLLAAVGTYGVMAYSVAERSREIGIRMAMGAEPVTVRGMILRQGGVLALGGLALGVAGSAALTRLLSSQLYSVGAMDPGTFIVVPLLLGAVALLACYLPAHRATRVDPVEALRES